jgi:tetratricopeptide (TPR) repeat protein
MRTFPTKLPLLAGALLLLIADVGFAARPASKEELNRIVNESANFLKNREPEMTVTEFALYEKVVAMLAVQPDFAMQLLDSMMSGKERPSAAFEFVLGNAHYNAGRHADAETHYRRAVERYPDYLRAWANLGVLYYSTGRYGEAVRCLAQAVELGDNTTDTLGLMAYALQRTGNSVAAEMAYLRALSAAPENVDWVDGLCGLYVESRQFGRAESLARQLVRLQPRETRYWLQLAGTLIAQERRTDAVVVLETARELQAANPELLLQLGDLYAQQQFAAEATAAYRAAMQSDPQVGAKRLIVFAQVLGQQGQTQRALEMLAGAEKELPRELRVEFLQVRADLHVVRKEWPAARQCLEELLAEKPLCGSALLRLGQVHKASQSPFAAQQAFEAAAQIADSAYLAHLELADIELRARHYQSCIEHLESALQRESSPAIQEYLGKIKLLASQNENQP